MLHILIYLEDFKIDLRHTYHQETLLTCRHATNNNDNLHSIRKTRIYGDKIRTIIEHDVREKTFTTEIVKV